MPAPLTTGQKQELAMLFRDAFALAQREAREARAFLGVEPEVVYLNALLNDAEEWRHEMVSRAVSKNGLTCCSQDDYGRVKSYVLNLLGRKSEAAHWAARDATNPKRVADSKIKLALGQLQEPWTYAESICRRMFQGRVTLVNASAGQTWKVYYALNKEVTKRNATKGAQP